MRDITFGIKMFYLDRYGQECFFGSGVKIEGETQTDEVILFDVKEYEELFDSVNLVGQKGKIIKQAFVAK